jgi:hypothetical protein
MPIDEVTIAKNSTSYAVMKGNSPVLTRSSIHEVPVKSGFRKLQRFHLNSPTVSKQGPEASALYIAAHPHHRAGQFHFGLLKSVDPSRMVSPNSFFRLSRVQVGAATSSSMSGDA